MSTFPRFSDLPLELQDKVWDFFVPPRKPLVHIARLHVLWKPLWPHGHGRVLYLHQVVPQNYFEEPPDWTDPDTSIAALLITCRSARAAGERILRERRFAHEAALNPPLRRTGYAPPPAAATATANGFYPRRFDSGRDLILLHPHWDDFIQRAPGRNQQPVSYLAIPPLDSSSDMFSAEEAHNLYDIYRPIVLYFVCSPGQLVVAAKVPWPRDGALSLPTFSEGYVTVHLKDFIDEYYNDTPTPGPFIYRGTREYYEIPVAEIPRLGGLSQHVAILQYIRSRRIAALESPNCPGRKLLQYRLMTWRDIPPSTGP